MDRHRISRIAHTGHPIAAPLTDQAVTDVLNQALSSELPEVRLLDLGCGGAEWLLRALEHHPGSSGVGVDISEPAVAHARAEAHGRGLAERLRIEQEDAAGFDSGGGFDVVFAVGVSHVFGGLLPTLAAARDHLAPGGRVVLGDGFWESPPSAGALEIFGPMDDLAGLVGSVTGAGCTPLHGHISSRTELDAYEWAWTGALASWGLQRQGTPDGQAALAASAEHRREWLTDYRPSFGFVTLVLQPL